MFDFRAHFCHSAPIETHAFGSNAPEGQKRFPTSKSDFLSISRLHRARAALRQQLREKDRAGIREGVSVPGDSAAIGWSPGSGAANRQILRASPAAPSTDAWPLRPRRAGRPDARVFVLA